MAKNQTNVCSRFDEVHSGKGSCTGLSKSGRHLWAMGDYGWTTAVRKEGPVETTIRTSL
jgi:hypothetical protein